MAEAEQQGTGRQLALAEVAALQEKLAEAEVKAQAGADAEQNVTDDESNKQQQQQQQGLSSAHARITSTSVEVQDLPPNSARATHAFGAEADGDLSLTEGDIVVYLFAVLFCDLNNEPRCGCVEISLFVPDTSSSPKPAIHTL